MLGQFLSRREFARTLRAGLADERPLLSVPRDEARNDCNRRPYLVSHQLQHCHLFSLQSICQLAQRLPPSQVAIRRGKIPGNAHFERSLESDSDLSVTDAADGLSARGLYLYLSNAERDPEYRDLLLQLLGNITAAVRPFDGRTTWYSTYLFVSSDESVTPYHMDREMNYLLQIAGTKRVRLWDPALPTVMTEEQKNRLLSRVGERPGWRPELDQLSTSYELTPGTGVYQPFIWPHLVETTSALSISLASTFRTTRSDRLTHAHQFNQIVRRVGVAPRPAGSSGLRNRLKSAANRAYSRARALSA